MYCPYCGSVLPENSAQCLFCGKEINSQPQQPQYQQAPPQQFAGQPYGNPCTQPPYGEMNQAPAMPSFEISNFANKAKSMKTQGIIAAVLMFGIGIFFSIGIWVSKVQIPQIIPSNPMEQQMLDKAIHDYNLAKKLSFLPLIGIALSFIFGFIGGLAGIM